MAEDQDKARNAGRLPSSVAVVVPCYNAGDRVQPVVERLCGLAQTVIVVDDGSTDGCLEGVTRLPVRVVSFDTNLGKGHALRAGIETALERSAITCVACLDADGQHAPAELPGLYAAFRGEDADMVIGSRAFSGGHVPWRSRFGNTLTISIAGWLLGRRIPDTQSGYRLLSRQFLEAVMPEMEGARYEFEMEMIARAIAGGYRVVPVPIQTLYESGNPSSHFRKIEDSWRIYRTLIKVAVLARRAGR